MSGTAWDTLRKNCFCAWATISYKDLTWVFTDCVRSTGMCSLSEYSTLIDQLKTQSLQFHCPAATNSTSSLGNQQSGGNDGPRRRITVVGKGTTSTMALALGIVAAVTLL